MPIIFADHYTRALIKANPQALFVFGDNMIKSGMKGQAAEARGEVNAVGIPTKWLPERGEFAYFSDQNSPEVMTRIVDSFTKLRYHLKDGGVVVFPSAPLGSGYAKLDEKAPKLYKKMQISVDALVDKFGTLEIDALKQP